MGNAAILLLLDVTIFLINFGFELTCELLASIINFASDFNPLLISHSSSERVSCEIPPYTEFDTFYKLVVFFIKNCVFVFILSLVELLLKGVAFVLTQVFLEIIRPFIAKVFKAFRKELTELPVSVLRASYYFPFGEPCFEILDRLNNHVFKSEIELTFFAEVLIPYFFSEQLVELRFIFLILYQALMESSKRTLKAGPSCEDI